MMEQARLIPPLVAACFLSGAAMPPAAAAEGLVPVGNELSILPSALADDTPSICSTPDGGFVVARAQGEIGASQVVVRRFDENGSALGSEFAVSGVGPVAQADVACAPDGVIAVVWSQGEEEAGGTREDIYARIVSAKGVVEGDPFRVNVYTTGRQLRPAVCAQGDGRFAAVWIDRNRDVLDSGLFWTDGRVRLNEIVAQDPRAEVPPDIACASSGRFLVVWGDFPSSERNDEVAARAFGRDGSHDGSRFFVNSITTGDQTDAVVCASGDDGYVVAWRNTIVSAGGSSIHARRIMRSGRLDGPDFQISPLNRRSVAITCGESRSFVAVTTRDSSGGIGVFAQKIESAETVASDETTAYSGTVRSKAGVAGDADAIFPIIWSLGSGDPVAVRGRLFTSASVLTTTSSSTTTTVTTTVTTTTIPVPPVLCGDANDDGGLTVVDALMILQAGVGAVPCEPCRCDSDGSGAISATDALLILSLSIGVDEEVACPPCA